MSASGNNSRHPLKFPFEIKAIDPVVNKRLLKDFTGESFSIVFSPKQFLILRLTLLPIQQVQMMNSFKSVQKTICYLEHLERMLNISIILKHVQTIYG